MRFISFTLKISGIGEGENEWGKGDETNGNKEI